MAWRRDGRRRELVNPHCDRHDRLVVLLGSLSCEEGSHFVWWWIFPKGEVGDVSVSWACLRCRCE